MRCSDHHVQPAMLLRYRFTAGLATALLALQVSAQDLGVIGPVYPIAEPSLLDVILTHLRKAEATGVLGQLQRDAQSRIRRGIEQPEAITNVSKTTKPRTHYYDPSLVVPYAITDADGRIIIAPGTTVNPLDTVSLSKHLLFFDARDAAQVKRARALLDQHAGKVKLILTGGSYLDLMKRWKTPVFYDQQGLLTTKLRIQQVPALVYQEGRRLRIDEIL
jgi:conjugal transfer pilus assembly protein TraW